MDDFMKRKIYPFDCFQTTFWWDRSRKWPLFSVEKRAKKMPFTGKIFEENT